MSAEPTYPAVSPYLLYEDAAAAIDWLCQAFGFRERLRYENDNGVVSHAELEVGSDGLIMIGYPGPDYQSPDHLGQNTTIVHVYVDDVDAHCRHAKASGARITR
jgi:uncharacterized glyoxalase superfamily protein PhnB